MARWTDEEFDLLLAKVLRAGVAISAFVVALGAVIFLATHGFEHPSYAVFRGEPARLRSIAGIVEEVRRFSGRGVIQLGLLLLIATPIARVVFSVAGFARQRDRLYVVVTLTVLALLAYSLLGES